MDSDLKTSEAIILIIRKRSCNSNLLYNEL